MTEQPGRGDVDSPRPPRRDDDPDAAKAAARRALWLGLGGLLFTVVLPFWQLGLVLGVAAIVVAVKARRMGRVEGPAARQITVGLVTGVITTVVGAASLAVSAFLYPVISSYSECMDRANTLADEKVCKDAYEKGIRDRMNLPDDVWLPIL